MYTRIISNFSVAGNIPAISAKDKLKYINFFSWKNEVQVGSF